VYVCMCVRVRVTLDCDALESMYKRVLQRNQSHVATLQVLHNVEGYFRKKAI